MNFSSVSGKKWLFKKFDSADVVKFSEHYSLTETVAKLLSIRKKNIDDVNLFLNPKIKNLLPNPLHLKDMKKAVDRTYENIIKNEQMGIFGDYDVDGASSTAILSRYFLSIKQKIQTYIPDRQREGYGPSESGFENLIKYGYGRLDAIIKEAQKRPRKEKPVGAPKHVLVAPSWGPKGTLESGVGAEIIDQSIKEGYKVTLRPHPQTVKFAKVKIDAILKKHRDDPMFIYEGDIAGQDSLHDSDVMISDWSGVAMEYAYGFEKPVLFIDLPRKINNPEYAKIEIEPIEVSVRNEIGKVVQPEKIPELPTYITNLLSKDSDLISNIRSSRAKHVFNQDKSACIGANFVEEIMDIRS